MIASIVSSIEVSGHLFKIDSLEPFANDPRQSLPLDEMFLQPGNHPGVLHGELLAVVDRVFRADVAPGREDMAVLGDLFDRRSLAEAGGRLEGPLAVCLRVPPLRRGLAAPLA